MAVEASTPELSWRETLRNCLSPRVLTLLFLGFSAGLPILLIFSSLSLWLLEAGVERSAITFFSWAALGYSFKFVWAPLVDQLRLPLLTRWLGQRRGWLLLAQGCIIGAILLMALIDPSAGERQLVLMACGAVLLGFSSATQDIVIDAYRIEVADKRLQGLLAAAYITGYRLAMIVAGAGALVLASRLGSELGHYNYGAWRMTYLAMAGAMLVGVLTTLLMPEPKLNNSEKQWVAPRDSARFVLMFVCCAAAFVCCFVLTSGLAADYKTALTELLANHALASVLVELLRISVAIAAAYGVSRLLMSMGLIPPSLVEQTYIQPIQDFFTRHGVKVAVLLLLLIGCYRISDIVLGIISNVFYLQQGYSKEEIAAAVKTFGVVMAIVGGFLGGGLTVRFGIMRMLMIGALLSAATNLLFVFLAMADQPQLLGLYLVVAADNLSAGLASAAFVAFLSSLTNVSFTAMQYALFSSLMLFLPKSLAGYSGSMVDGLGYPGFFVATTLMGVPVILLIWLVRRYLEISK